MSNEVGGPPDPERVKRAIDAGASPSWLTLDSAGWLVSSVPDVAISPETVRAIRAAEPAFPYLLDGGTRSALLPRDRAAVLVPA